MALRFPPSPVGSNAEAGRWPSRPAVVRDLAFVIVATGALLALAATGVDLSRLHLGLLSFNDQVGYVAIARRYLDEGSLSASIIYPSTLLQEAGRDYLYMPGYYFVLAASYFLFGYGSWQSLLPNLAAYALSALGVYLIALRLFGRGVGLTAAILFLLYPPNIVYAFSAMSELTRLAASVLAVGVFVYLPPRWRFWAGPWLLAVPVFFRETAFSLVAFMVLLLAEQPLRTRLGQALWFCAMAVLITSLLLTVGPATGRPTLLYSYVFDASFATMHTDALGLRAVSTLGTNDWLLRLPIKGWENLASLAQSLWTDPSSFLTIATLVLLGAVVAALFGWIKWRDQFFAAVIATLMVRFVFLTFLYDRFGYGWLRMLLTLTPFLAIVLAVVLGRHIGPARQSQARPRRIFEAACLGAMAVASVLAVHLFFRPAISQNAVADQHTLWLEHIDHDDRLMLVAPVEFLDYVHRHYPVKWAFIPANRTTLEQLAEKYPIGTLIMPRAQRNRLLSDSDLADVGLVLEQQVAFGETNYLIYRAAPPGTAD